MKAIRKGRSLAVFFLLGKMEIEIWPHKGLFKMYFTSQFLMSLLIFI